LPVLYGAFAYTGGGFLLAFDELIGLDIGVGFLTGSLTGCFCIIGTII